MPLARRALLLAALLPAAARAQPYLDLGREWVVREQAPDGRFWDGIWVRRGMSNVFDAEWRDSATGGLVNDVIEFRRLDRNTVVLHRFGNRGDYFGELSPDGRIILRGTASWYTPGYFWSGRIRGRTNPIP